MIRWAVRCRDTAAAVRTVKAAARAPSLLCNSAAGPAPPLQGVPRWRSPGRRRRPRKLRGSRGIAHCLDFRRNWEMGRVGHTGSGLIPGCPACRADRMLVGAVAVRKRCAALPRGQSRQAQRGGPTRDRVQSSRQGTDRPVALRRQCAPGAGGTARHGTGRRELGKPEPGPAGRAMAGGVGRWSASKRTSNSICAETFHSQTHYGLPSPIGGSRPVSRVPRPAPGLAFGSDCSDPRDPRGLRLWSWPFHSAV